MAWSSEHQVMYRHYHLTRQTMGFQRFCDFLWLKGIGSRSPLETFGKTWIPSIVKPFDQCFENLTSKLWGSLNIYICHFFLAFFCHLVLHFLSFLFCAVIFVVIFLSFFFVVFSSSAGGWTQSRPRKSKNVILPAHESFFLAFFLFFFALFLHFFFSFPGLGACVLHFFGISQIGRHLFCIFCISQTKMTKKKW